MLDPHVVATVRSLLADGVSQRAIARRLAGRISRGSIHRIATGKRPDRPPPDDDPPPGPAQRCTACGRKVVLPCRACGAAAEPRRGFADAPEGDDVALELKPAHRARYQEVRHEPAPAARAA